MEHQEYEDKQYELETACDRALRAMLGTDPRDKKKLAKRTADYERVTKAYDDWMSDPR